MIPIQENHNGCMCNSQSMLNDTVFSVSPGHVAASHTTNTQSPRWTDWWETVRICSSNSTLGTPRKTCHNHLEIKTRIVLVFRLNRGLYNVISSKCSFRKSTVTPVWMQQPTLPSAAGFSHKVYQSELWPSLSTVSSFETIPSSLIFFFFYTFRWQPLICAPQRSTA